MNPIAQRAKIMYNSPETKRKQLTIRKDTTCDINPHILILKSVE